MSPQAAKRDDREKKSVARLRLFISDTMRVVISSGNTDFVSLIWLNPANSSRSLLVFLLAKQVQSKEGELACYIEH
jgi:hypothetical protein